LWNCQKIELRGRSILGRRSFVLDCSVFKKKKKNKKKNKKKKKENKKKNKKKKKSDESKTVMCIRETPD
jgi:hypothetical protein